jgi:CheY-like chemotaxis protein
MTTIPVAIKTVLVADDTAFVRDRFREALERAGHEAVTVATAHELLSRLRERTGRFDLIVLDLRLPRGHGTHLLKAIQKAAPEHPPVLVFSGTIASAAEVRELASLGVAGYVNEYAAAPHILPSLSPHLFPDHYNRRSGPRVVVGIPVAYRVGRTVAAALTLSLSEGGLSVRTTNPVEVGTPLKVRLRLPQGRHEIDAGARVAWVDGRGGMGMEWTSLSAEDRMTIEEFVRARFFSNRKA